MTTTEANSLDLVRLALGWITAGLIWGVAAQALTAPVSADHRLRLIQAGEGTATAPDRGQAHERFTGDGIGRDGRLIQPDPVGAPPAIR